MPPTPRSWLALLTDKAFGWWTGLPWEKCGYTVESLSIPVGNSVNLAANLYLPTISKPHGTILIRSSYGIHPTAALSSARVFAPRGYVVLLAACRGTHPSDGQALTPAVHEAADGAATVRWLREQPWYTGSFVTYGGSYLGYTQFAMIDGAEESPADLKGCVIMTGMANFGNFTWGKGAMDAHIVAWADLMTAGKRGHTVGPLYIRKQAEMLKPVYDGVPLVEAMDKHFQGETPEWLTYSASHPDLNDPHYKRMDHSKALEKVKVPVLQTTGWGDVLISTVTRQHEKLVRNGCPATLTMGPWTHLGAQRGENTVAALQFIEKCLSGGGAAPQASSPVRVFVTGSNKWLSLSTWPPPESPAHNLFLGAEKVLTSHPPTSESSASRPTIFTFDPKAPTPAIALPRPFDGMAPHTSDDTSLADRSDVAAFTSAPLDSDLTILGRPSITLHHTTDNPYADVFVRLSEVARGGKSTRISDAYLRLNPNREAGTVTLELADCAHKFTKGNRIRVVVAGGAHPAFGRNLGSGENPATGTTLRAVEHTVWHSSEQASQIRLPVSRS